MRRSLPVCAIVFTLTLSISAHAQFGRRHVAPPPPRVTMQSGEDEDDEAPQQELIEEATTSPLRARFGADHAEELLRTTEGDEVRRGIMRAASSGTPEAVSLLVAQADGPNNDDLTLIELVRALAPFAKEEAPRLRLVQLLNATARVSRTRTSTATAISAARVDLARQIAARALVASRDPKALDAVVAASREGGSSQQNALRALASDPVSSSNEQTITPPTSASAVHALAQSGDLRVLDVLLAKAQNGDASIRAASMVALGQLGDGRARPIAIAAFADPDPHVRAAAGEALVLLDALERFHAVTQLISSDETMREGVRLAHRAQDGEVVKALAARFAAMNDPDLRLDILAALGRGVQTDDGLKVLASVAADPKVGGDAVHAIARSPNAHAMATLERLARERAPMLKRLAVRGYVARAVLRGERSSELDAVIADLRASNDGASRSLAAFARVALKQDGPGDWLDDRDAAVRRAAAMGALAGYDGRTLPVADALLRRYSHEPDEPTRAVLAIGLLGADTRALVPTRSLIERVEAGGADAALSATALAARKGDTIKAKLEPFESSPDPIMRAHVARGLGASEEPSATGRLAEATRYEAEPLVRFAQIVALAARPSAPSRNEMLSIASRFDPEARIRDAATRGLANAPPPSPWPVREVAWLRVATETGAPPSQAMLASYITSEGVAIPIAFDADGYALVLGVPPGDGRLVLSPTLPSR